MGKSRQLFTAVFVLFFAVVGECVPGGLPDNPHRGGRTSGLTASPYYYGSAINADALANTPIGGPYLFATSFGFRATHTGFLRSIRIYVVWSETQSGYNAGTGGSLLFSLQNDDGTPLHHPSGTSIASVLLSDPMGSGSFPLLNLSPAAQVNEGQLYHIVITNADQNPAANYVSVNSLWMQRGLSPKQPAMADTQWFQLLGNGTQPGNWRPRENGNSDSFTPILELQFTDGYTTGMGYMEVWVGNPKTISGDASVREYFKVSGPDQTVSSVSVRLRRDSGTDSLTVLLQDSMASTFSQASLDASSVPTGYGWVTFQFPSEITLASGHEYFLTLTSPSTTAYDLFAIRKGSSSNVAYSSTTYFDDGYAQFNDGSGWTGWDQWGSYDRRDGDLQFAFHTDVGSGTNEGGPPTSGPTVSRIAQNYPNPFNSSTRISYAISNGDYATLTVYDASGAVVTRLFSGFRSAGQYVADWDASRYSSGVYFCVLRSGFYTGSIKLLLLK